jgi:hypothetical protein
MVAEEVTQDCNDTELLAPMVEKAEDILDADKLTGLGDSGYYNVSQLKECEDQNITVHAGRPHINS